MRVNDDVFDYQDDTHILHPSSRSLFRFWEAMRAEQPAPVRDELDLKRIGPLIPNLFIAEYAANARMFRWRLAGTRICELYNRELTGSDMLADWDNFETDVISRFLTGTMHNRQPAVLRFRLQTDRDQIIGAEMSAFPLLSVDRTTIHIFGGLFPFREISPLGYDRLVRFELSAARHVWTENFPSEQPAITISGTARRQFRVIPGGLSRT